MSAYVKYASNVLMAAMLIALFRLFYVHLAIVELQQMRGRGSNPALVPPLTRFAFFIEMVKEALLSTTYHIINTYHVGSTYTYRYLPSVDTKLVVLKSIFLPTNSKSVQ